MARETVRILDTTLRDGLRGSGIAMGLEEKIGFARQLERLGVDVIEIGFGGRPPKPISITSTPRRSSWRAKPIFSSRPMAMPDPRNPSRSVVSKMRTVSRAMVDAVTRL